AFRTSRRFRTSSSRPCPPSGLPRCRAFLGSHRLPTIRSRPRRPRQSQARRTISPRSRAAARSIRVSIPIGRTQARATAARAVRPPRQRSRITAPRPTAREQTSRTPRSLRWPQHRSRRPVQSDKAQERYPSPLPSRGILSPAQSPPARLNDTVATRLVERGGVAHGHDKGGGVELRFSGPLTASINGHAAVSGPHPHGGAGSDGQLLRG